MSSIIYKVIFKGIKEYDYNELTLTFKDIISEKVLNIPPRFFFGLKELSEHHPNIMFFKNIEDVKKLGNGGPLFKYKDYMVILYKLKSDRKREGFLIGNEKKSGYYLIGIWPFNRKIDENSPKNFLDSLLSLIKKPDDYENTYLIN